MEATRGRTFKYITSLGVYLPSLLQVDIVGGEESELALALAKPPTLVHLKVCKRTSHKC